MSVLSDQIRQHIVTNGPITIAKYMEEALGHPRLGYYMGEDPLGRSGDFITAPEISQMFGELIGLWCGVQWKMMGQKEPFNLIELGPGRGTLMADILRAGLGVNGFIESLVLSLVEISPVLKGIQEETLLNSIGSEVRKTRALSWISQLSEAPDGPFTAVANEFIDVLGIRQFQKTTKGWRERLVDVSESEPFKFQYILSESLPEDGIVPSNLNNTNVGDIIEIRPAASALINEFCSRLKQNPGCVLLIDYGHYLTACGNTLQAISNHAYCDPMDSPGTADITAHVNFELLNEFFIKNNLKVKKIITQQDFLRNMGIIERAENVSKNMKFTEKTNLFFRLKRLMSHRLMGNLFKVILTYKSKNNNYFGFN